MKVTFRWFELWTRSNPYWYGGQEFFFGQSIKSIQESTTREWEPARFWKAHIHWMFLFLCMCYFIIYWVWGELFFTLYLLLIIILFEITKGTTKLFVFRGIILVTHCIFVFLVWYVHYQQYAIVFNQGWFGNTYRSPCDQSACSSYIAQSDIPYNPNGYFTQVILHPSDLNLKCPASDCYWGRGNGLNIHTYLPGLGNEPDYSQPCNASYSNCVPSQRPEDYPNPGLGINGGYISENGNVNNMAECNHPDTIIHESSLPSSSTLVCTFCSAFFAYKGILPPLYLECGRQDHDEVCLVCPGALTGEFKGFYGDYNSNITFTRGRHAQLAIATFVFFILSFTILVIAGLTIWGKDASKKGKMCGWFCRPYKVDYDHFYQRVEDFKL